MTNVSTSSLEVEEQSSPSPPSETSSTSGSASEGPINLEESLALDLPKSLIKYRALPRKEKKLKKSNKRKADAMYPYQSRLLGCLEALQNTPTEGPRQQDNIIISDEYEYFGKSVAE